VAEFNSKCIYCTYLVTAKLFEKSVLGRPTSTVV